MFRPAIATLMSLKPLLLVLTVGVFWVAGMGDSFPVSAADETTKEDQEHVKSVNLLVLQAGRAYTAGDHQLAGERLESAIEKMEDLLQRSPETLSKLNPALKRVKKIHVMLDFEGIVLEPLRTPQAMMAGSQRNRKRSITRRPSTRNPQEVSPKTKPSLKKDPLSFTSVVAPILVRRCGQCHVSQARGGFQMNSYAALMKGAPEGVVIFPKDVVGSRLIETIETGDMPRGGGRVAAAELKTLKDWVLAGAQFDGQDPQQPLSLNAASNPSPPSTAPKVSGTTTVSFSEQIAGILVDNCVGCHIDATRAQGGLRMDTFALLMRGGDSGKVIIPGDGQGSLLVRKLRGMEGQRMPAGGRPALAENQITLIRKWIDEGASLDAAQRSRSLKVMSQLAWAKAAVPAEISTRRSGLAEEAWKLVSDSDRQLPQQQTEHFLVMGETSKATLDLVAKVAEKQMKTVTPVVGRDSGEAFFRGRVTLHLLPKRYQYSEFARMVEKRSVPAQWKSHWSHDGVNAYVAMVVTETDDEETIAKRLLGPLTSLAVATGGRDVPRWFAEGVGVATAARKIKQTRDERIALESETSEALAATENARKFLTGKLSPQQSDRVGAAFASGILGRSQRKNYNRLLRILRDGTDFETAFAQAFGQALEPSLNRWLAYVKSQR